MTHTQQDQRPREPREHRADRADREEVGEPSWFDEPAWSRLGAALPQGLSVVGLRRLVHSHHARGERLGEAERAEARRHYRDRLDALRQGGAAIGGSAAVDLEMLVREALRDFLFGDAEGIHVHGPPVMLRAAPARVLLLVLHELTTNSIKFGALGGRSRSSGLRVQWRRAAGGVLRRWQESGVAVLGPAEASRHGFGQYLIETGLASFCAGKGWFRLRPGGLECTMALGETSLAT